MTDSAVVVFETLNADEEAERRLCEEAIRGGLQQAWVNLRTIRDRRLYRSTHESFDSYCQSVWGYKGKRGQQLARAGEVVTNLIEAGVEYLPDNERQARELVGLDVEELRAVAQVIKESAVDGRITATHVKAVATYMKDMLVSGGAVDDGTGEQKLLPDVIKAGIVEEAYERLQRQREHIRESLNRSSTYVGERTWQRGHHGIFELLDFLHSLDSEYQYLVKVYRKEKGQGESNGRNGSAGSDHSAPSSGGDL